MSAPRPGGDPPGGARHGAAGLVYAVDLEGFEQRVLLASRERPILVDMWAEWCPPCRTIAPVLEQVVARRRGGLALAKVEVDAGENMKLAGRYRVRGFPTVILFRDGQERGRFSGARPARFVEDFVEQCLAHG